MEKHIDAALKDADAHIHQMINHLTPPSTTTQGIDGHDNVLVHPPLDTPLNSLSLTPSTSALLPGECTWLLQQRCPACFGGSLFGRPLETECVTRHSESV